MNVDYATGWAAAALFGVALAVPLVNRARRRARQRVSRRWISVHNGVGSAATLLGVGHCVSSATRAYRSPLAELGTWAGAAAVGLLVISGLAGATLAGSRGAEWRRVRRGHVVTMVAVLVVGVVHTLLNGPFGLG